MGLGKIITLDGPRWRDAERRIHGFRYRVEIRDKKRFIRIANFLLELHYDLRLVNDAELPVGIRRSLPNVYGLWQSLQLKYTERTWISADGAKFKAPLLLEIPENGQGIIHNKNTANIYFGGSLFDDCTNLTEVQKILDDNAVICKLALES